MKLWRNLLEMFKGNNQFRIILLEILKIPEQFIKETMVDVVKKSMASF